MLDHLIFLVPAIGALVIEVVECFLPLRESQIMPRACLFRSLVLSADKLLHRPNFSHHFLLLKISS